MCAMKKRLRLNDPDDIFDLTLDSFVEEQTPAKPSKPTPQAPQVGHPRCGG